jgi:hypothetical protein
MNQLNSQISEYTLQLSELGGRKDVCTNLYVKLANLNSTTKIYHELSQISFGKILNIFQYHIHKICSIFVKEK